MLSWEARGSVLPPPCVTGRFSCEAASPRAMLCAQAHHGASSPVPPPPKKQLGCSTGALCASPGVGNCHGESKVVALWDPTNPGAVTPAWARSSPSCAYLCSSVRPAVTRCWACCIGWGWCPRLGLHFVSWFMGPRCGEDSEADGYAM